MLVAALPFPSLISATLAPANGAKTTCRCALAIAVPSGSLKGGGVPRGGGTASFDCAPIRVAPLRMTAVDASLRFAPLRMTLGGAPLGMTAVGSELAPRA